MIKKTLYASLAAACILSGCAKNEKLIPDLPENQLFQKSQTYLEEGNFRLAIELLEALDNRYPFGHYTQLAQFNLIYAYYKKGDFELSLATIKRFMRLHPTHPNTDWLLYMKGLAYSAEDISFLHSLFLVDRAPRDRAQANAAFISFKKLLINHPQSTYTADAKKRMEYLKNSMARHDLAIADYYLRRKAYIAAINRAQEIQKSFPDTQAARESLVLQLTAYQALNLPEAVSRTKHMIALNPTS